MKNLDNAERIYQELRHEQAAIWYISDIYGAKIMVKLPSNAIKALVKGCRLQFIFGKDELMTPVVFHVGLRVYDDPVHYLTITCNQRFADEHNSLAKIMSLDKVYVHFHNELNVLQAIGTLSFSEGIKHDILSFQGNPKKLYRGNFSKPISHSLDCFEYSLGFNKKYSNPYKIETLIVDNLIAEWQIMENLFMGNHETVKTGIDNIREGEILEKELLVTLGSLFANQTYKSPQIPYKQGKRELIDILAFSEYGIFLVEAKALGVIEADLERTMERKVIGIQKQIDKAINQLIGATKQIAEDVTVYKSNGSEIVFNKKIIPHCIVLVTELLPFGDWQHIEMRIIQTMAEHAMFLNVFDLKEFMRFIGYSKGSKYLFDDLLMKRAENFAQHKSIHVFTEFVGGK